MRAPVHELTLDEITGDERLGGVRRHDDGTLERVIAKFATLILAADRIRANNGYGRPALIVGNGPPQTEASQGSVYIDAQSGDIYKEAS